MSSITQPSDSELVIWNYVRNQYENLKHAQNVPMALKYLILQFSKKIISSKMLTVKQDIEFFKSLISKLPSIRKLKLLYRASENAFSSTKFHELCDDEGPTIAIIESNWGNIFGGYTTKSWKKDDDDYYFGMYKTDENAFLFMIKSNDGAIQKQCPLILEMRDKKEEKSKCAIYCDSRYGPTFGSGHDICIRGKCNEEVDEKRGNYSYSLSQCTFEFPNDNLSGSKIRTVASDAPLFQVIDYEVFKVES